MFTELRDVEAKMVELVTRAQSSSVVDAIMHNIKAGGKRLRPLLVLATTKSLGGDYDDRVILLAACCELLHTASLILDDVVDNSRMRRGKLSVNTIWGNKIAVLSGAFLLSVISISLVKLGNHEILKRFSEVSKGMADGEILQLEKSFNPNITLDEYLKIISLKTAGLFSLCCEIPCLLGFGKRELAAQIGFNLGMAFQIKDDILDYVSGSLGKPPMKDVKEGKITIPIILAIKNAGGLPPRVLSELRKPKSTKVVLNFVRRNGGIEDAMKIAEGFKANAKECIKAFTSGGLLDEIADFILRREV